MFLLPDPEDFDITPPEPKTMRCPICSGDMLVNVKANGYLEFPVQENGAVNFNMPQFFVGEVTLTQALRCAACGHFTTGEVRMDTFTTWVTVTNESENSPQ